MAEDFRGRLGGLDDNEFEQFLDGDYLARVACLTPDGAPYVIPLWYQWDGAAMWLVGRQRAVWCEYMKNDPRVSLVVDAPHSEPDESGRSMEIPKVIMQGNAEVVEEPNVGRHVGRSGQGDVVPVSRTERSRIPDGDHQPAALAHQGGPHRDNQLAGSRMGPALLGGRNGRGFLRGCPRRITRSVSSASTAG